MTASFLPANTTATPAWLARGAELDFGIYVEIGAILATACASSSWVWANLVSHHWMLAWWPEAAQREQWEADPDVLIGSAFVFPCGRASKLDGGYRLQGRWPFSSGIDHCSWLMVGGQVAQAAGEPPELRMFLVPPGGYAVIDTWHVAGLRGTGSRDVVIA